MDVARTAIRKGVQELTCFSITRQVAASHHEFSYAQLEGVQFEYNKAPVEITDRGVIFRDVVEGEDGSLTPVPGSEKLYESDSVIISISQGPMNRIVSTTQGLRANARGLLVADETGHTTPPGDLCLRGCGQRRPHGGGGGGPQQGGGRIHAPIYAGPGRPGGLTGGRGKTGARAASAARAPVGFVWFAVAA